ncbi:hypothetical protein GCM10011581_49770 [Saccharopolyspora subtropica]|uniref:YbaB/EbfC DNA-binding family protein n=1 Tax=Saccharopolyspora thermophila TaxID=89367 RepID=A0A917NLK4_9PSEU|nr:YbaB/EbfC family nucleoid-associated protein [Saccharopolyspora subtropica]GGJ06880.1 hypothetical protein GCM10011581_49770 [Saccharopolyspora subtropica]
MSGVDRRNVEMLREEFEKQMARLGEMQERMSRLSATAVSPRRELSVTVGQQGVITEVKFLTSAYRQMTKKDLSELVLRTITEAREKMAEQAAELMGPFLPPGLDAKALMSGAADVSVPGESMLPSLLRDRLDRQP